MEIKVWKEGEREKKPMQMEGAIAVEKEVLVGHKDNSPRMVMRKFEVEKGGETPYHSHNYEHVIYVLKGTGKLKVEGKEMPLPQGASVLVPPNVYHQFINAGEDEFHFICVVPEYGDPD
jgi:quercetin dioxygenase-like cupin family protein